MRITNIRTGFAALFALLLAGCGHNPLQTAERDGPEKLIIHEDGSMKFRGHPIPEEDVVIYDDGSGGEMAAVRVRMKPLHPDFFRDTIIVERRPDMKDEDVTLTRN